MSVILVEEPKINSVTTANDLPPGTWFCDVVGDIFLVVLDDRTNERRVVCAGDFCRSFLVDTPIQNFKVDRILDAGSILQITNCYDRECAK